MCLVNGKKSCREEKGTNRFRNCRRGEAVVAEKMHHGIKSINRHKKIRIKRTNETVYKMKVDGTIGKFFSNKTMISRVLIEFYQMFR